jgi:hypothetical protein
MRQFSEMRGCLKRDRIKKKKTGLTTTTKNADSHLKEGHVAILCMRLAHSLTRGRNYNQVARLSVWTQFLQG